MAHTDGDESRRVRRAPPRFRRGEVRRVEQLSSRMVRVTLAGEELEGLELEQPAASLRLLLPGSSGEQLVLPTWDGNQFLLPGGDRPTIRTLTPRRVDPALGEVDVHVVVHGRGAASSWAQEVQQGDPAAISGFGRGYRVDEQASGFVLGGDETAIAAIGQLLEVLPRRATVDVHVEVADPAARLGLPDRPDTTVTWWDLPRDALPGDALLTAVRRADISPGTRVWLAGEAAGVQRIRRHLFEERGLARAQAAVRGYWRRGHAGGEADRA